MFADNTSSKRKSVGLAVILSTILFIFILTLSPAPTVPQATANIQPDLLVMASEQPETAVRVIIQKSAADIDLQKSITNLGGKIVQDLQFVQALAAELPAKAVLDLANIASVNWVSLDTPFMSGQTSSTSSLRDEFNQESYNNNDGLENWATSWIETNDDGNPSNGDIEITNSELMLKDDARFIQRSANLPDAATAVLSFDYRRYSFENSSDYVAIQISTNQGASWIELDSFAGPASDGDMQTVSYDIAEFIPNNIIIRFATSTTLSNYDELYIDNLQIEFEKDDSTTIIQTVRDQFDTSAFDGNNGSANWISDWIESNDGGSPTGGDITVEIDNCPDASNRCVEFDADADLYATLQRSANLDGATTATLTFDYRLDDNDAIYLLEASTDGGNNWATLKTYQNDALVFGESIDLTAHIATSTSIRFQLINRGDAHLFLDNVQIVFDNAAPTDPPPMGTSQTVRDEFSQATWENNDGTMDWADMWTGYDYGGNGATEGYVYIQDGRFTFHYIYAFEEYAVRSADLSGSAQATLSFDWQTQGLDSEETISILVSQDGEQFTELAGYGGSQSGSANFDITEYIASTTTIRFENRSSNWESGEYAYFDNVQIEAAKSNPTINHYLSTANIQPLWEEGLQGQGVTVAVIDSGISPNLDFGDRLIAQVSFNANAQSSNDSYGHGTHIAGIIGGNGNNSNGFYQGVAPQVNLIGLKVSDENGMAYESDTVAAMQWVLENKDVYNIRVVNISLNSTVEQSYHTSPFDLASELLWFNGVVVVASAGNRSLDGNFYTITASPANDPFIITVGASTEADTGNQDDDDIALFSAHGTTVDGFVKPDIIAPGYNIVSVLSNDSAWDVEHPDRLENDGDYFRLSGTSMAAPIVSGATALLLQAEPDLTPDQVKYRLMNTGSTIVPLWFDAIFDKTVYPYLDVNTAVTNTTTEAANQDTMPHMALAQMALIAYWANQNGGATIDWDSVDWSIINWDNVDWDTVDWDVVDWGSVNWGSVNWGSVNWGSVNWGSVNWGSVNWGSVNWGSVNWGSVNWGSVNWGSVNWGSVTWDD